jgi:hypothetical protein
MASPTRLPRTSRAAHAPRSSRGALQAALKSRAPFSLRALFSRRALAPAGALCATLAVLVTLGAAPAARADRRSFIRAYEYATQPEGNLELEIWNDLEIPRGNAAGIVATPRVELEVGLTDHWDMALYHVFKSELDGEKQSFSLDSWRLETRYRLLEKGVLPVDVMFYLEAERPADFREPWELEEKIILAKDIGRLGLVTNFIAEQKLASGDSAGHEFEIDIGARWEFIPALRVGVEYFVTMESAPGQALDTRHYLGPSVSLATGKLWLQFGAGFGLGDNQQVFARAALGFNL